LQVKNSSRFIYSNANEFAMATKMIEENAELKEIKGKPKIGEDANKFPGMPKGEQAVFYLAGKHFIAPIKLEINKYDLIFYCSDFRLKEIFDENKLILCIEIFSDGQLNRLMREVVISNFNKETNRVVIKHENEGLNTIVENIKNNKFKK
ncbi:MAG TPA: hypothetical protein VHZ50_10360, partial [Puia sp.]|nr:hypothetical protein [Puia sp.]